MVEPLGDGHLHGGAQNTPGLTGQSFQCLAQQLQTKGGDQRMSTTGGFQGVGGIPALQLFSLDGHRITCSLMINMAAIGKYFHTFAYSTTES